MTPEYVRIEDLPVVLRYVRGERSRSEVAEESGVSSSALARLEDGEPANPSLETLRKLSGFLERPIVVEP